MRVRSTRMPSVSQVIAGAIILALGATLALLVPAYPIDFAVSVISSTPGGIQPLLPGRHPSPVPGGGWLAYDDSAGLWLQPNQAGAPVPLVGTGQGVVQEASFSPDGSLAVYVQSRADEVSLMLLDVRQNTSRLLARPDRQSIFLHPAWSPRGDWIAFTRLGLSGDLTVTGTEAAAREIWMIRPDGTGLHYVTQGAFPAWSPTGDTLAFERPGSVLRIPRVDNPSAPSDFLRIELPEIWLLSPGSETARRVTRGSDPAWSPDGRHIALADYRISPNHRPRSLLNAFRQVTALATRSVPIVAQLPTGWLSTVPVTREAPTVYRELWVFELESGRRHRITDAAEPLPTPNHPGFTRTGALGGESRATDSSLSSHEPDYGLHAEYDPAWSPDGRTLFFSSYLRTSGGFFVYSATFLR